MASLCEDIQSTRTEVFWDLFLLLSTRFIHAEIIHVDGYNCSAFTGAENDVLLSAL